MAYFCSKPLSIFFQIIFLKKLLINLNGMNVHTVFHQSVAFLFFSDLAGFSVKLLYPGIQNLQLLIGQIIDLLKNRIKNILQTGKFPRFALSLAASPGRFSSS